jgi:hypothetical protein
MIGNEPVIDKFIHDYATSLEVISLEKWGEKYGVSRQTITKWIKEYNTNIEEINRDSVTEFNKNIQRVGEKALSVINRALDEGNEDIAVKVMPYITPKKEQVDLGGSIQVNQPMAIAIKKLKENMNVAGGE